MQKIARLSLGVAFVATLSLTILPMAAAQDLPEMSDEAKDVMNTWMELAQPGEHHDHLAAYVGKWKSEVTMWMEPGAEPMTDHGEATAQMILGGRYLEWVHTGVFGGMPFEGRQIDAYNNADQRYEATWADNFGTLILYYTGECDGEGKTRTMHTEFTDPMSGDGKISHRVVYTWEDEDNWLHQSYMSQGGEEFQNMEIRYTRVE